MISPYRRPENIIFADMVMESFKHWIGKPLIISPDPIHALYTAPFALVAHGTEPDPVFHYANQAAQEIWGLSWDEFLAMPSRLSAEPSAEASRQTLLDEARKNGYVSNYRGVRVAKNGRRFMIKDTMLWNVIDNQGRIFGQAARMENWQWL